MKERILVTGYKGQLGYDVIKELTSRNVECKGVDIEDFDITDYEAVNSYIENYKPTGIIHCSAYTAVDKAEENPEICYNVNSKGTENMARIAKNVDAKFILISTDYVFDGSGEGLVETNKPYGALGVYGNSKVLAEQAVKSILSKYFIVRTTWVFGKNGNNFVKTMLRLSETKEVISVVDDQIGSPTYTVDFAKLLSDMILSEKYGTYHCTNEGFCSCAEFASEIMKLAGRTTKIEKILTKDYKCLAKRPLNSRLNKQCLSDAGFMRLPPWQDAVKRYLKELEII